jgi:hypothetical protein
MNGYVFFALYAFVIIAAARWAMRGFPLSRRVGSRRAIYAAVACFAAYVAFQFLRTYRVG